MKKNKGFTLAELLIIVAIISILVGISIPVFSMQLEKSRRAVDMANARSIIAALKSGMNTGEIEFTSKTAIDAHDRENKSCIAIVISKNNMNCFVSGETKIEGLTYENDTTSFLRIKNYLKNCGIKNYSLSSKNSNNDGWAFYTVFLYSDGTSRIASGTSDDSSEYKEDTFEYLASTWYNKEKSNIEKAMNL